MKKRLDYVDIFKAFGILLMVIGHIGFGTKVRDLIYCFHMPMFFFISGWLYNKKNLSFKQYIFPKIKTLLLPYFLFGIFYYFLYSFFNGIWNLNGLKHLFFVNTDGLLIETALWFLTALFLVYVLVYFVEKINNNKLKTVLILLISCVGLYRRNIICFVLPYALGQAFVGILFFYCGKFLRKKIKLFINKIQYKNKFVIGGTSACLFIVYFMLIMYNGEINMRTELYGKSVLIFFFCSLLAIISTLYVSYEIFNYKKIPYSILSYIGKNSIIFVCFNHISIFISNEFLKLFITGHMVKILCFPLSIVLMLIISFVFDKTSLKKIFGK